MDLSMFSSRDLQHVKALLLKLKNSNLGMDEALRLIELTIEGNTKSQTAVCPDCGDKRWMGKVVEGNLVFTCHKCRYSELIENITPSGLVKQTVLASVQGGSTRDVVPPKRNKGDQRPMTSKEFGTGINKDVLFTKKPIDLKTEENNG